MQNVEIIRKSLILENHFSQEIFIIKKVNIILYIIKHLQVIVY